MTIDLRPDVIDLRLAGAKPRVHGNGFIQLDLDVAGRTRLHVWDDRIPRQSSPTPIHDHVFALRSRVLCGTLIHEELTPVARDQGGTHRIFRAQQEEGTQNTILVPDVGEVVLDVEQRLVLGAGSVYTFPAYALHQTNYRGTTATIMRKIPASHPGGCMAGSESRCAPPGSCACFDYGRPRVLVPVGAEPDNEFRRDAFAPEPLWLIIAEALSMVRP